MPKNGFRDRRVAYGARCTWWDSIDKVGTIPPRPDAPWLTKRDGTKVQPGLPCCPHCGGVLFEVDSIEDWNASVERFAAKPEAPKDYREFVAWSRGKCFPRGGAARAAFDASRSGTTPDSPGSSPPAGEPK